MRDILATANRVIDAFETTGDALCASRVAAGEDIASNFSGFQSDVILPAFAVADLFG